MPFGITPSLEIFQKPLHNNVADLEGLVNKADGLLVVRKGKTMEEAMADHDWKPRKLLQRCSERGMCLNAEKMNLRQNLSIFMERIVTTESLRPDPEKSKSIKKDAMFNGCNGRTTLKKFCELFDEIFPTHIRPDRSYSLSNENSSAMNVVPNP